MGGFVVHSCGQFGGRACNTVRGRESGSERERERERERESTAGERRGVERRTRVFLHAGGPESLKKKRAPRLRQKERARGRDGGWGGGRGERANGTFRVLASREGAKEAR
jgi:hypothetical protein